MLPAVTEWVFILFGVWKCLSHCTIWWSRDSLHRVSPGTWQQGGLGTLDIEGTKSGGSPQVDDLPGRMVASMAYYHARSMPLMGAGTKQCGVGDWRKTLESQREWGKNAGRHLSGTLPA